MDRMGTVAHDTNGPVHLPSEVNQRAKTMMSIGEEEAAVAEGGGVVIALGNGLALAVAGQRRLTIELGFGLFMRGR
jgi:hypothetical protein